MKMVAFLMLVSLSQLFFIVNSHLFNPQLISNDQNNQKDVQAGVVDARKQITSGIINQLNNNQQEAKKCIIYYDIPVKVNQQSSSEIVNVYAICSRNIYEIKIESEDINRVILILSQLQQNLISQIDKILRDEGMKIKIKSLIDIKKSKIFTGNKKMVEIPQKKVQPQYLLASEQHKINYGKNKRLLQNCNTVNCTLCWNGVVDGVEQCDDGNIIANDGCTNCVFDCGNGILQSDIEQCDDGNRVSGDGCSSNCVQEPKNGAIIAGFSVTFGAAIIAIIGLIIGAKSSVLPIELAGVNAIQTFGIGQIDVLEAAESKNNISLNQQL